MKDNEIKTSLELSVDRLAASVRVLNDTINHFDMDIDEKDKPDMLKVQAH